MATNKETGPFLIRDMPLDLRVRLKMVAASRGTSMEKLIIKAVEAFVKKAMAGEHNAD